MNESGNITVTKHDLHLQLKVKVTVHEATQVPKTDGKPVFCVFEVRHLCFLITPPPGGYMYSGLSLTQNTQETKK